MLTEWTFWKFWRGRRKEKVFQLILPAPSCSTCPEQTLLRNYGRSSRRFVQDPRKARRLYSYLPWCNSKLYNLLPQPGCMQSKMLKATHHFTADIMSGVLVKKKRPQNSQCANLEVIDVLLVKRHQNRMQVSALHTLIPKTWQAMVITARYKQDHGHFSHKKEFCSWPKKKRLFPLHSRCIWTTAQNICIHFLKHSETFRMRFVLTCLFLFEHA